MFVEILMATYQGAAYLNEMIRSIQEQTHTQWKLIVRDDGSNDKTIEIIKKAAEKDPRIVLLPSNERLGVIGNFSRLMEEAQADYIMFADQDDVWHKNKIEVTLQKMHEMESIYGKEMPILVHTDLKVVDSHLQTLNPSFWKYAKLKPVKMQSFNRMLMQNVVTGCAMMVNKSLCKKSVPIPAAAVMHDWWIALVASALGHIEQIPISTISYRQHGKNQIGANHYHVLSLTKRLWNKGLGDVKQRQLNRFEQVLAFKERYRSQLCSEQQEVLDAFIVFSKSKFSKKVSLMLVHHFYKYGVARNLGELVIRNK